MRVVLTRSSEDAAATAARLVTLGFTPLFAPALSIRATGAAPPDGTFEALIATSAAAFTVLAPERYAKLASLALYVVGERTAEVAGRIGLSAPRAVAPGAAILAALICDRLPQKSRVLFLAGRDRTGDIEEALGKAGHRVTLCEIYEALAREVWSAEEAQAYASGDVALYYSRRSAEIAVALAREAGLREKFEAILHLCISENAAEPLRGARARKIVVAAQATEAGLFEALKQSASAR
ncbi:MAG TPA: uroporphyrinogen-III synthase [Roseiarcus sp.]|jgi:uroporphyrinogen-III synthase|nr:uroporphyrinogen-III synthase [Roseiarcus sp.]